MLLSFTEAQYAVELANGQVAQQSFKTANGQTDRETCKLIGRVTRVGLMWCREEWVKVWTDIRRRRSLSVSLK